MNELEIRVDLTFKLVGGGEIKTSRDIYERLTEEREVGAEFTKFRKRQQRDLFTHKGK